MRYTKVFLIFIFSFLVSACAYTSYTRKLDVVIPKNVPRVQTISSLDIFNSGEQTASIGESLFRVTRYRIGERELIRFKAPTQEPFPQSAVWSATHVFNDQNSGDLLVYTTPSYYNGAIGVILDKDEKIVTREPLVQLEGAKRGRRWRLSGEGKFFDLSRRVSDKWILRYGGKTADYYTFEIVNEAESSMLEMQQSIRISEASFSEGFTIRGVFVKGLSEDRLGIIKYSVTDLFTAKDGLMENLTKEKHNTTLEKF